MEVQLAAQNTKLMEKEKELEVVQKEYVLKKCFFEEIEQKNNDL